MSRNTVKLVYDYYPDPSVGRPVFNGSVYVGEPDQDPELFPKQVYHRQETGEDVPVGQPLQTGAGGVILINGSPAEIVTDGSYSLRVRNSSGAEVYYDAIRQVGQSFASVTDSPYNAVGDGVADDTAALQAAIDNEDYLYFPAGTYNHTGLTVNRDNVRWEGSGRSTTKLVYQNTEGNAIEVGDVASETNNFYIQGFWLAQAPGADKNSGAHLRIYNFLHGALKDLYITDFWTAITIEGAGRSEVIDVWFRKESRVTPMNRCLNAINNTTYGLDIVNLKCVRLDGAGVAGWVNEGFYFDALDWVLMDQCHMNQANYGITIDQKDSVVDFWVTNTYLDRAEQDNCRIIGSSGQPFLNIVFDNVYFRAPQAGRCLNISNTGADIENLHINNCRFNGGTLDAIYMDSVNVRDIDVHACRFEDMASLGGSTISSKAIRLTVTGSRFDNTQGNYDIEAIRDVPSGGLIVNNCDFAKSTPITDQIFVDPNFVNVYVRDNISAADNIVPPNETGGTANVSFDASGIGIIPHGLGVTPTTAYVQRLAVTDEEAMVTALDATNITLRCRVTTDDSNVNANRNVLWFAKK